MPTESADYCVLLHGCGKVTSLPTKPESVLELVFRVRAQTEMKIRIVCYRHV